MSRPARAPPQWLVVSALQGSHVEAQLASMQLRQAALAGTFPQTSVSQALPQGPPAQAQSWRFS